MKRYSFHGVHEIDAKPTDDIDGEYVLYEDHVEAMKRIAGDSAQQAFNHGEWIRNNYQDHPNVASLVYAMNQAERAAPAPASPSDLFAGNAAFNLGYAKGHEDARTASPAALTDRRCQQCNAPRKGDECHKCGAPTVEPCAGWEEPELPPIDRIRELAREVGYAVGVHGTLERDLDLIAAPWSEDAARLNYREVMQHIADGLGARLVEVEGKPLGRRACTIQMDGWYKPIDLSVCQMLAASPADQAKRDDYERAYRHGWINSAKWANRVDLVADIDSPAYNKDRDEAMKLAMSATPPAAE